MKKAKKTRNAKKAAGKVLREEGLGRRVFRAGALRAKQSFRVCLELFRSCWNGWNGTRLFAFVRPIPTCLSPT